MKMVTLPDAVIFGTMIGLGVTGFCCRRKRARGTFTFCWRSSTVSFRFLLTPERMRLRRGWGDNDDGFGSAVSAGGGGLRSMCIYQ